MPHTRSEGGRPTTANAAIDAEFVREALADAVGQSRKGSVDMDLSLDPSETRLLQRVLQRFLMNLRQEIADTEKLDWRQSMHEDEDRLKAILERLPKPGATTV